MLDQLLVSVRTFLPVFIMVAGGLVVWGRFSAQAVNKKTCEENRDSIYQKIDDKFSCILKKITDLDHARQDDHIEQVRFMGRVETYMEMKNGIKKKQGE